MRGSIRSRHSSPRPAGPVGAKAAAPPEACQLLEVVSLWWQIQLDPKNRVHDDEFRSKSDAVIAAIEAWTEREPKRGEAWFYLGGAYGARAQWRVLREERLAAARDGKRIKNALEQALALDPSLNDAYFGIGLYHYYADVAPAAFRMLRWVLLLPGGNRLEGMREMLRARSEGQLLQSEADYQLHLIYLWYEKQPQRALQLLRGLRDRHPRNPLFVQLIAEIQDVYLHDLQASRYTWQALLESAQVRRVAQPATTEATARIGLAGVLDRLSESDTAMQHLRAIIEMKPAGPYGVLARAQLKLGQVLDRLGPPRRRAPRLSRCTRHGAARRSRWRRPRRASWTSRTMSVTWTKYDERVREASSSLRRKSIDAAVDRRSIYQSSIVNRRSRCSDRSLVPTLDIVGAIARVVGYRGDTIF